MENTDWVYLVKSLSASERANLLVTALQLLDDSGAICTTMTFDGAAINIAMCKILGKYFYLFHFLTVLYIFMY